MMMEGRKRRTRPKTVFHHKNKFHWKRGNTIVYRARLYPVIAYGRHLDEVLHGRVRQLTGAFKEMEEGAVVRDGVQYYPMTLNVGDMESQEDDRLFYYDANLPRPDWKRGEQITVTAHDKALGAWTRA